MAFDPIENLFLTTETPSQNMILENSSVFFNLYHFKVMQLETFEDNGDVNECKLRFHFFHRLISNQEQYVDSPRSSRHGTPKTIFGNSKPEETQD